MLNNSKQLITPVIRQYAVQAAAQHKLFQQQNDFDTEWNIAKPYSEIPGPSKITLIKEFLPGGEYHGISMVDLQIKMNKKYGKLSKFPGLMGKRDVIFLNEPKEFEKVFRTEGVWPIRGGIDTQVHYRRNIRKDVFKDNIGIALDQGEQWGKMRTMVNPVMLPPRTVKMYIPVVDEIAREFLNKIKLKRDSKNELPATFGEDLNKWSLESIGFIALDQRLGVLNDDDLKAKRLVTAIKQSIILSHKFDIEPSIWKYYETPKFKTYMKLMDEITFTIMKYIDDAMRKFEAKSKDVADHELSVVEKLLQIDRHTAIVMALDMLSAGVDTTSTATIGLMYHLANNPDKQEKLREEIRSILPDRNSKFKIESLNTLPYMRGCFKESMRLSPIIAGNVRASGKNLVLQGYQIPKEVDIFMTSGMLQIQSEHFPNPSEYLPERWLKEKNTEQTICTSYKTANPFIYLPFGFGTRACIGKRFAEMEIQIFIARLLQQFKLEWHYPPIKYSNALINAPIGDLKFRLIDI